MTVTPSSIEQVIPGQGSMAQPSVQPASKAKRKRFRFVSNGKAATGLIVLGIYVLIANLLADIAYLMLDPRTRKEA